MQEYCPLKLNNGCPRRDSHYSYYGYLERFSQSLEILAEA